MTSTRPRLPVPQPAVDELRRLDHATVVVDAADVQVADPAGLGVPRDPSPTTAGAGDRPLLLHVPLPAGVER